MVLADFIIGLQCTNCGIVDQNINPIKNRRQFFKIIFVTNIRLAKIAFAPFCSINAAVSWAAVSFRKLTTTSSPFFCQFLQLLRGRFREMHRSQYSPLHRFPRFGLDARICGRLWSCLFNQVLYRRKTMMYLINFGPERTPLPRPLEIRMLE